VQLKGVKKIGAYCDLTGAYADKEKVNCRLFHFPWQKIWWHSHNKSNWLFPDLAEAKLSSITIRSM